MENRSYYSRKVVDFISEESSSILGRLSESHRHALEAEQKNAWISQINILKEQLQSFPESYLFVEFLIPRMGKRADAILINNNNIFVLEFKVGSNSYDRAGIEQVEDYALDLKNFHEGSHNAPIIPILIATNSKENPSISIRWSDDKILNPLNCNDKGLKNIINNIPAGNTIIDPILWANSLYKPTPTIVEAAKALYESHKVDEITRSDADRRNLADTSKCISEIIEHSKLEGKKSICFVTGVPGAGKTLAGLNIATQRADSFADEHAVFLSGNGPLVNVLREALARDQSSRENITKAQAAIKVRSFIQNIHHFRDDSLATEAAPIEKVAIFDEAQRAWTKEQAVNFMRRKRGDQTFNMSEPEFLISVMNRHTDWCTIVCLIGGGQEINTGEAGLTEWLGALKTRFQDWDVYISPKTSHRDYCWDIDIAEFLKIQNVFQKEELHLSVSIRSFRAEKLSAFIGCVVDNDPAGAKTHYESIKFLYPIKLTRDISKARTWLKNKARGSERYGIVASAGANRLKAEGISRERIDAVNWFLNDKSDVRSSFYLEDIANEFDVQGLELDWTCICWDADFRYKDNKWNYYNFKGTKWQNIKQDEKKLYLKNAYRVLLTRARQGFIIYIPLGDNSDPTRPSAFYDETYEFLIKSGITSL